MPDKGNIENIDSDQLGQLIRMNAHFLDVYLKCKNKDRETAEAYNKLTEYINEWISRGNKSGPDKAWAKSIISLYEEWSSTKNRTRNIPVNTDHQSDKDIFDVIKSRRSVRFWKKKPIPKGILNKLIESAVYAPSAFNKMPWKFYIVENKPENMIEGDSSNKSMIEKAPARIYIAIDERLYEEKYAPAMDAALATQNILLTAHSLGLGACMVYQCEIIDQDELKSSFNIPEYYKIYCAILLGYPDEFPAAPGRVDIDEVAIFT